LSNSSELSFNWSVNWASICTSTAVDALVSVDYEDVAISDSFYWTFWSASAASDASISNFESHNYFPPY
jgi:hypothetical protein